MVRQGDIIKTDFNPIKGSEQAGYRPAIVISNKLFTQVTNMTLVCAITNTKRKNPLYVKLSEEMKTTGFIMCDQTRAIDLRHRPYKLIERAPREIAEKVSFLIKATVEIPDDYE